MTTNGKTIEPHAARTGEDRSIWYGGYLITFLAAAEETGGAYALVEEVGRKGASSEPPMHVHGREEESFYVIEGEMTFYVGDRVIPAPAGTHVVLPRGVPHRFELTSEEVRCLNLITPAGFEGFYRELGEPARALTLPPAPEGPPDVARLLSVAAKYGCEILPPPPEG